MIIVTVKDYKSLIHAQRVELIEKISQHLSSEYECIEVEWNAHSHILRIFLDRFDGGDVLIEDCVKMTKLLQEKSLGSMYDRNEQACLEVSSPGVERPLRLLRHFKKFVGEKVHAVLVDPTQRQRHGEGILVSAADDDMITLMTESGEWSYPLQEIHKAKLVHHWGS